MGDVIPDLRDLVARAMERERVPGVAYGVLEDDKVTMGALGVTAEAYHVHAESELPYGIELIRCG